MYSFSVRRSITGNVNTVWAAWTDPDSFPRWDPREIRTHLNGVFAVGSAIESKQKGNPGGTATITAVEPGKRWEVTSALPGGSLIIDHVIERAANGSDGTVSVTKRYDVTGPLVPLFKYYYAPKIRRALPASFDALEAEAARRG